MSQNGYMLVLLKKKIGKKMLLISVDGISFLLGIDDKEKNVFDFLKIIYYFYHCFHIFVF